MRIISDGAGKNTFTYDDDGKLIPGIVETEIIIPVYGPNKVKLTFIDVELNIGFDKEKLEKLKEKMEIE